MGIVFYPRGGSAQVARYLSRALEELGHRVHLVTGTLRDGDPEHDAGVFYGDLKFTVADYTEAWQGFQTGLDAITGTWEVPFHPSYEDKPEVPDRAFYKVDRKGYQALLRSWKGLLKEASRRFQPDIVHLHHLSHMNAAAAEALPSLPQVTQLHGTEITMLERLQHLDSDAGVREENVELWRGVLANAAKTARHLVVISSDLQRRAAAQLSIKEKDVTTIANGVATNLFGPLQWTPEQKLAFLRRILIEEPQGWDESQVPGSIRYTAEDLERFKDASGQCKPLVMFVGRFLTFKRVPLLVRATARVSEMFKGDTANPPFNLVIWGGMPGECEGQHPFEVVRELGLSNVFFTGWLPHSILSTGLNVADLFVAPSYYEPFGQVYLEAMATGIPVIATRTGGPVSFVVDHGPDANGWFSELDDVQSLADKMYEALRSPEERRRRGANALALIRRKYDWIEIAKQYEAVFRRFASRG